MSRTDNRGVIAGKLHVAVVVRPFHLPGVDTKLAHIARIAARAQPVLHRVIDATLCTIQAWRRIADLVNLLGEITGVDRCTDSIRLVN